MRVFRHKLLAIYRIQSGKLWYLQHNRDGDTIIYHSDSDIIIIPWMSM